jgi:hypothetical protein
LLDDDDATKRADDVDAADEIDDGGGDGEGDVDCNSGDTDARPTNVPADERELVRSIEGSCRCVSVSRCIRRLALALAESSGADDTGTALVPWLFDGLFLFFFDTTTKSGADIDRVNLLLCFFNLSSLFFTAKEEES